MFLMETWEAAPDNKDNTKRYPREGATTVTSTRQNPDEAFVGKELNPRTFKISQKAVSDYFEGLGVDSSIYLDLGGRDTPLIPSMVIIDAESINGASFTNNFGNLWMRQEVDIYAPLPAEERLNVFSKVIDIYEWRNRTIVLQESEIFNEKKVLLGTMRHHQSYLLNQNSGKVALRKPSDKEGVRKFEVPKGELLETVSSEIDLEMCGTFFHGNKNYHTNKTASEALGFEEVVVGGKMTISYIGDMLDRTFGERWVRGGKLDVKFTNIVWPGDKVTARGVIADEANSSEGLTEVRVWMEKEDGTVTIVGNAYLPQD
ncbi:MaoC family dehydratase [Chloroflexi bacterium]|nr:MaoC family dehydratase [Chloroflexota bacterium]